MKISGIYKIQSKIKPERIYIGSAVYVKNRWNLHLSDLRKNKHHSIKLQRHFNKYGEVDLQFSILLGCEKEDLLKIEQYFIDSYKPYFNNCKIAGSQLGVKRSAEAIKKMSISRKGHKWSPESIVKRTKTVTGQKRHPHSKETKRKIGEKSKGRDNGHKGMKMPDYLKAKLLSIHLGSKHSEEHKKKIGDKIRGRKMSDEFKQKIKDNWIIRKQNKIA